MERKTYLDVAYGRFSECVDDTVGTGLNYKLYNRSCFMLSGTCTERDLYDSVCVEKNQHGVSANIR